MKLEKLLALKAPTKAQIDAFLKAHKVPLVSPGHATFIYRGDADNVRLRQWVHGLPTDPTMYRLGDSDLWYLETELPDGSRVEYKFEVTKGDDTHWITDPLNPATAQDPFGRNSVCQGYGYQRPDWTLPDASARSGSLERIEIPSPAFGDTRALNIYLPARFRKRRRYPTLIVHDGVDFVNYADFITVLDNLMHRMEVAPMVVALSEPVYRNDEYAADERHAKHLTDELYPELRRKFGLDDHPESRGLMGASFGAIASLHAALSKPGFFDRLLLMSGSFAFSDVGGHHRGAVFDPVVEFINAFRKSPARPAQRIYMSCGIYESLIYENRSMLPFLRESGARVRYEEKFDGHNWENWRDRLQIGLSWLFPGPLWMTYE